MSYVTREERHKPFENTHPLAFGALTLVARVSSQVQEWSTEQKVVRAQVHSLQWEAREVVLVDTRGLRCMKGVTAVFSCDIPDLRNGWVVLQTGWERFRDKLVLRGWLAG